jgi:hypothetical protein
MRGEVEGDGWVDNEGREEGRQERKWGTGMGREERGAMADITRESNFKIFLCAVF